MKFVPKGSFNKIPALIQITAWCRPGDKLLSEPMMIILLTHICVTRPQWVKAAQFSSTRLKWKVLSLPYCCRIFITLVGGIVLVDGMTCRSNTVVISNAHCDPQEIVIKKFGNITGIRFHIVAFAKRNTMSVSEPFVGKERTYCDPNIYVIFEQCSLKYVCIDCFTILTTWFLARRFYSQYCLPNFLNLVLAILRLYWALPRQSRIVWHWITLHNFGFHRGMFINNISHEGASVPCHVVDFIKAIYDMERCRSNRI